MTWNRLLSLCSNSPCIRIKFTGKVRKSKAGVGTSTCGFFSTLLFQESIRRIYGKRKERFFRRIAHIVFRLCTINNISRQKDCWAAALIWVYGARRTHKVLISAAAHPMTVSTTPPTPPPPPLPSPMNANGRSRVMSKLHKKIITDFAPLEERGAGRKLCAKRSSASKPRKVGSTNIHQIPYLHRQHNSNVN